MSRFLTDALRRSNGGTPPSRRRLASLAAALLVAAAVGLAGCFSPGAAIQEGVDSATSAAGETVGEAVGAEVARAAGLPPAGSARYNRVMASQAQVLFTYAFSAGGMWPAEASYEPGEWTQYRMRAAGDRETGIDTLQRAFLKTTDDGSEWWRVRGVQDGEVWVYEGLLNPETNEIVRLRGKDPKGEVGEVPVSEQTVYRSPQRLTEESVEGATVGTEEVDTPAGTFTARRVEYSGATASGTVVWLLSDAVPGHVVQYRSTQGEEQWTSTLVDYGSDATTQLDSY
jgi:hypothetical protein